MVPEDSDAARYKTVCDHNEHARRDGQNDPRVFYFATSAGAQADADVHSHGEITIEEVDNA